MIWTFANSFYASRLCFKQSYVDLIIPAFFATLVLNLFLAGGLLSTDRFSLIKVSEVFEPSRFSSRLYLNLIALH